LQNSGRFVCRTPANDALKVAELLEAEKAWKWGRLDKIDLTVGK
jgi:hypothetical protein